MIEDTRWQRLTGRVEPTIVLNRLREICPAYKVSEMDVDEVEICCRTAFKVIGFEPENFSEAFRKSSETNGMDAFLCDFIYDVWRYSRES